MTERGRKQTGLAHGWLILMTGWCLIQTAVGLLLGISQSLSLGSVITSALVVGGVGIIACALLRRRGASLNFGNLLRCVQPLNHSERWMVGAMSFLAAALLWRVATRPITDWDSLSYHLPAMAKWYQTKSLTMPDADQISRYPYNWEVLCALFLMPFREDFLAAVPNVLSWGMMGLAVYCLSLQVGATRLRSMAAACLVLTLPHVIENVNTMHIDLPFAAFFMAGLYFAVLFHRTRNVAHCALFLTSLGMLCGIKMSGPVYAALLFGVWVLMEVFLRQSAIRPFQSLDIALLSVLSGLGFLLLGGYWYVRNYSEVGNPFGLLKMQVAGVTMFPGSLDMDKIRRTTIASLFEPTNFAHWTILLGRIKNGLHFPFLVMGLHTLALPLAFALGRKGIKAAHLVGLMGLLLSTGFLYWTTPYSGTSTAGGTELTPWIGQAFRYAFPFMGVMGVAAAVGATTWRTWDAAMVASVLLSGLLCMTHVADSRKILLAYVAVVLLLGWKRLGMTIHLPKQMKPTAQMVAFAVCAALLFGATLVARKRRDAQRQPIYGEVITYLQERVRPEETIGYVHSQRVYLFYGKGFNRQVVPLPSGVTDFPQWLDALRQQRVAIVAVGPGPQPEGWKSISDMRTALASDPASQRQFKELVWLENPDGPFVRVCGQNPGREPLLYRFKDTRSGVL
jgi:hypothetical protein